MVTQTAVLWDVTPCSLTEINRRFRRTFCLCLYDVWLILVDYYSYQKLRCRSTENHSMNYFHCSSHKLSVHVCPNGRYQNQ